MRKKKLNRKSAFLLIIICCFSSPVFAETETGSYDEALSALGVRFIPPEGWNKEKAAINPEDGNGVGLIQPQGKAVIAIILNKRLGTDETSFRSALINYRDTIRRTANLISEEEVTFSGILWHVFVMELDLTTGKKMIKDYIFFKGKKAYTLTYTASTEEFQNYLPAFEKLLPTFEVVN